AASSGRSVGRLSAQSSQASTRASDQSAGASVAVMAPGRSIWRRAIATAAARGAKRGWLRIRRLRACPARDITDAYEGVSISLGPVGHVTPKMLMFDGGALLGWRAGRGRLRFL